MHVCHLWIQIFERLGAKEFLPQRRAASDIYGQICQRTPTYCLQAIESICGYNDVNINLTRLPLYLSYTPAGKTLPLQVLQQFLLLIPASQTGCLFYACAVAADSP